MAKDNNTKIQARITDVLETGENVLAAQALTTRGARAVTEWMADHNPASELPTLEQTMGVAGGLVLSERRLPTGFLVVVTEERVLMFGRSVSGKPKDLIEVWARDEVVLDVIDQGNRVRSRLFFLGLPDSTCLVGEAPINGSALESADDFVATFSHKTVGTATA